SYSVSLTTCATLVSPLIVPLTLRWTLGQAVDFPAQATAISLGWMVVAPVIVGHALSRRFDAWSRGAQRFGSTVANLTILWIIAVVVAANRAQLEELESTLFVALLALNVGGYIAGNSCARALKMPSAMRRALTLEVGMQNAGLGAVLAKTLFGDQAALAPAFYTFACMATGTALAILWSQRAVK
ncbi:MAG: bile acid:sodium symporter, partial [Planctomycetales bacterium]|nr:bile acid:sodium symporter [Planctomycetales bacterium]